jgi:hypothetical protein
LTVDQLKVDKATVDKFKRNQTYLLDSSKQSFQIEAWSDGWNTKLFIQLTAPGKQMTKSLRAT